MPISALVDPEKDEDRVQKPEWLIVVGVCTHLGCIPLGSKQGEKRGEYQGWFCPVMAHITIPLGGYEKDRADKTPIPKYTFFRTNWSE